MYLILPLFVLPYAFKVCSLLLLQVEFSNVLLLNRVETVSQVRGSCGREATVP